MVLILGVLGKLLIACLGKVDIGVCALQLTQVLVAMASH